MKQKSRIQLMLEDAKARNIAFLKSVREMEVEVPKQVIEQKQKIEKEPLLSAKWLMQLKSNLIYDPDLVYSEDAELHQIVKMQLREKILRQKEQQKKQYQVLLEELNLATKHQAWDEQISETFHCQYNYTQQGKTISLDIKYYDILKLNPQNYVNDTIINFFLRYSILNVRFIENDIIKSQEILIFNTYFCAKLLAFSNDERQLYQSYLQNNSQLQKWTKEDIFSKQFLLFPLHLKEHWAVIIIVNPVKVCEQLVGKVSSGGYMLYFDSLLVLDIRISLIIKYYLLHVYNATMKTLTNERIYELVNMSTLPVHQPIVPKQTNLVDCGMYMLEYVERFLSNPNRILSALNQDHLDWFPKVSIFIKRILIKKILVFLSQGIKDNAERYINNCNQIDKHYNKQEQFDKIDEALLEQLQVPRLQFYLSEEYNYYNENY